MAALAAPVDVISPRQLLAELEGDRRLDCHWVRQRARLIVAVRDSDGRLHAYDCVIHDEAHETGRVS